MTSRLIYLYILLVFLATGFYLFHQGEYFGVEYFKHGSQMQLMLDSAYRYGLQDCRAGNQESNI